MKLKHITKLTLLIAITFICTSFTSRQITWVAIGDSITYLNEHLDETGNRVTKGYLTRVTDQLPNIHYINKGYNGWTTGNIAKDIEKLGLVQADMYSVFLGTNDWWQGRPVGTIEDYKTHTSYATVYGAYGIIISKLKSLNAAAKIILITPMQRSDFVYLTNKKNNAWGSYKDKNNQSLKQFADAVIAIVQYEHFTLIDLYSKKKLAIKKLVKFKHVKDSLTGTYKNFTYPAYTGVPFHPATDDYPYPVEAIDMTYDGLHPSDKGNAVIAKMLVKKMKHY